MAEDLQNPDNVQAAAGNPAADGEEYEYEYIELAEGEELPEDAEYEYVEVSDDEMPSMIPPTAVRTGSIDAGTDYIFCTGNRCRAGVFRACSVC